MLSTILPVKTHLVVGYHVEQLSDTERIVAQFRECGCFARKHSIRTGLHPDQFVVLNSPNPPIVASSRAEIESQAELAEWTNADTVNVHGGGGYGDKLAGLEQFRRRLDRLSPRARSRTTVENDDKTFYPPQTCCRSAYRKRFRWSTTFTIIVACPTT